MKKKMIALILVMFVVLSACIPSQEQIDEIVSSAQETALAQVTFVAATSDVDTIVQATFQAMTAQVSTPTPADSTGGTDNIPTFTPVGGLSGSISGTLSYPSEFIPALAIVGFHVGGGPNDYYFVTTQQNESSYQIPNLPPGQYYVVAYVLGGGLSAGYSQAVPCGLSADCNDHTLISVNVNGGQDTGSINPQDWYAPDGSFPAYPLP